MTPFFMSVINIYMKLNQIYQSEEVVEEGLIHVFGKILKYVAIAIGVIFVVRTFKRGLSAKKEETIKQKEENLSEYYSVIIGARLKVARRDMDKVTELYNEVMDTIQEDTDAIEYEVSNQKDQDDEYIFNTLFVYKNRNDSSRLQKIINKVNDDQGMNFVILKKSKVNL